MARLSQSISHTERQIRYKYDNLFKPRPNYRMCLGFNADYAIPSLGLDTRVGTKNR